MFAQQMTSTISTAPMTIISAVALDAIRSCFRGRTRGTQPSRAG